MRLDTALNRNSQPIEVSRLIHKANQLTAFHAIRLPTEKYFQTHLKNCVRIPNP